MVIRWILLVFFFESDFLFLFYSFDIYFDPINLCKNHVKCLCLLNCLINYRYRFEKTTGERDMSIEENGKL